MNEYNCLNCHTAFKGYQFRDTIRKFCGISCKKAYHTVSLTCKECEKQFSVSKCASGRTYCSKDCYTKDLTRNRLAIKAERITIKCKLCAKPVEMLLCQYNVRAKYGQYPKYCSIVCCRVDKENERAEKKASLKSAKPIENKNNNAKMRLSSKKQIKG